MQNKDILVLDLETKKSLDEVGGQENKHLLGVSLVGIYSFNEDKFLAFEENEIAALESMLKNAALVIGFNTLGFDYPVIAPYLSIDPMALLSLDILKDIYDQVGHRVSLNSVAQMTLDAQKSANGLEAIKMYREGRIDDLKKYCLDDVKITRDVYLFGRDKGRIMFNTRTGIKNLNVDWQLDDIFKTLPGEIVQSQSQPVESKNEKEENGQGKLF